MFVGIANALSRFRLWPRVNNAIANNEYQAYLNYIEFSYPSNHTYKIVNDKLIPKHKLASRYKKIHKLLPKNLTSLVEVGCSKGFFVFSGSEFSGYTRGLGIDVNQYDIEVCRWVKEKIHNSNTTFEKMQLHELASRIDEFGGPFQTVLVLNTYQYLYFGSDAFPECYLNHDAIFQCLRSICSGRVIFNNRIALTDCQNVKRIAQAEQQCRMNYSEVQALAAASQYFTVTRQGKIGKYPLFTLDVK
jgi:hypothetical protein